MMLSEWEEEEGENTLSGNYIRNSLTFSSVSRFYLVGLCLSSVNLVVNSFAFLHRNKELISWGFVKMYCGRFVG